MCDGEDALERRMREISYLHLTRFVQFLLDRKDRMSMAVGLEVRVPFCDHRLVEMYSISPGI
jgi:asparagine synthase (glutamine-hydrolysing)